MAAGPAGHVNRAPHPGALEPAAIERRFVGQASGPIDHRLVDIGQIVEDFA